MNNPNLSPDLFLSTPNQPAGVPLRQYQREAVDKVHEAFKTYDRTLGVGPTGCGKTRMFSALTKERLSAGRVLILAHRDELIDQAREKLHRDEGIWADKEKANDYADLSAPVVVGSIQSLMGKRKQRFSRNHFATVICDEAHYSLSPSFQSVLQYFKGKSFGCTATPDRADKRNLGEFYDSIAFEIDMMWLRDNGYLAPIVCDSIPLKIDLRGVRKTGGDFRADDLEDAIGPVLESAADAILERASDRKILAFLPLIRTSKRFAEICTAKGYPMNFVSGECPDRKQKLAAFARNDFRGLANSSLLTTGYDQPDVDCIVMLRPTQSRPLYVQCVGRGTRISPGKRNLLLLDFLYLVEKHNLIKPANLVARSAEEAEQMSQILEAHGGRGSLDLRDMLRQAEEIKEEKVKEAHARELSMKKALERKSSSKGRCLDPIEFGLNIHAQALIDFEPVSEWESDAVTDNQRKTLEQFGFDPDSIRCKGHASQILNTLFDRRRLNLASPKQVNWLIKLGHNSPHTCSFTDASAFLSARFSKN